MSDGPKVYRDNVRRALKNHKCCECYSTILKGEQYHVFTGLWDDWSTYKTCSVCNDLRNEVDADRDTHDDCLCFGELIESIFECRYGDQDRIKRFIDNMIFRGKVVPDWMTNRLKEL